MREGLLAVGTYADFTDVQQAAYGLDIPSDSATQLSIEALIAKAEKRLLARVPSIPARIEAGTLDIMLVQGVVEDVVIRLIRNPQGFSSEQAGEFSYRIDRLVASGRIEITDDDVADLLPKAAHRGFGSMRLDVPAWRLP